MNHTIVLSDKQLRETLEQIIFQKEELQSIARQITLLAEGTLGIEEFKTKLLESRVRIYNNVLEFSKFYRKNLSTNSNSEQNLSTQNNDDQTQNQILQEELTQKATLLEEIAQRLQKLII